MHRSEAEIGTPHTSRTGDAGAGSPLPPRTGRRRTCSRTAAVHHAHVPASCTCSRSAAAAAVRRAVRRELSAVVHGALPEASAAVSVPARTRVHGLARGQLPARLTEAWTLALIQVLAVVQAAVSGASRRASDSAQRPEGAEARGIPARRGETAQRARQGSPAAKRRAQRTPARGDSLVERRGGSENQNSPSG